LLFVCCLAAGVEEDVMLTHAVRPLELIFTAMAAGAVCLLLGALPGSSPARAGSELTPQAQAPAPAPAAAADPHQADRAAIQATMQSFSKAFLARDARSLAAHWTSEGEYRNDAGVTVRGRAALERDFGQFFARTPELKVESSPGPLRFLASDAAVAEGSVAVRRGPTDPASRAQFTALLVREQGRWLLAQLSETAVSEPSLADFAWMVGEWKSVDGQGAEIHTTYSWAPSKNFLHGQFQIRDKDLNLSGFQVIGFDPATGGIHSWTFEADGGIGEASWSLDGDHWVLDVDATLVDGSTLSATNILHRINNDTFTWQSTNRTLDDSPLPDLAPVKVSRVPAPAAPGRAAAPTEGRTAPPAK
jgi:uncharacterized protein (TIGR02246 family)